MVVIVSPLRARCAISGVMWWCVVWGGIEDDVSVESCTSGIDYVEGGDDVTACQLLLCVLGGV